MDLKVRSEERIEERSTEDKHKCQGGSAAVSVSRLALRQLLSPGRRLFSTCRAPSCRPYRPGNHKTTIPPQLIPSTVDLTTKDLHGELSRPTAGNDKPAAEDASPITAACIPSSPLQARRAPPTPRPLLYPTNRNPRQGTTNSMHAASPLPDLINPSAALPTRLKFDARGKMSQIYGLLQTGIQSEHPLQLRLASRDVTAGRIVEKV